jgi:hypothetical protein
MCRFPVTLVTPRLNITVDLLRLFAEYRRAAHLNHALWLALDASHSICTPGVCETHSSLLERLPQRTRPDAERYPAARWANPATAA